ncbi:MAG: hypothetical protein WCT40_01610 [Candidatus Magasanikbacteria bacterium]|jgi:hypothetical protein
MDKITAQENVNISREQMRWACDQANEKTAEYSRFLTGVASVVFGLSPLIRIYEVSNQMKFIFIISLILVIISLIFGAVHMLLEKNHFEKWTDHYYKIFNEWRKVTVEEISPDSAIGFEEGVFKGNKTDTPIWPLITQSILLFLGFVGLLIAVSVSIY